LYQNFEKQKGRVDLKYILVIGDGMADNPVEALDGLTPLEKAKKPYIDGLAARGHVGSVKTIPEGYPPGSDTAIMSIFGCPPQECYSGRAPLEAAAQGLQLSPGDAAFRCNMVGLSQAERFEDRIILSHSAGGIGGAEAKELVEYLFNHPDFAPLAEKAGVRICPTDSYRHIAVKSPADIKGIRMQPPHDHLEERVGDNLPTGCADAEVLTELMRAAPAILYDHPINVKRRAEGKLSCNGIWFWAEGTAAALPNFQQQFGHNGAVISAVPLCHGIATLAGLDVILVPGATGELDTNFEGKIAAALEAVETHDFVAVHIEAPDECTHNGDLPGKIQAIEWLDSRTVEPLCQGLKARGMDFRMLILSDHKTLTKTGAHDGDPVPFLIYDSREDSGEGRSYTEKNGEASGRFIDVGVKLMPALFQL
jgi:2,3-bisphosphoglycerate-independent phosphoglycerate mutase